MKSKQKVNKSKTDNSFFGFNIKLRADIKPRIQGGQLAPLNFTTQSKKH